MKKIQVIDLHFLEDEHSIAAFLIESSEGPVLIESGPLTTYEHLKRGVKQLGHKIEDIKHVILTHIHFDHAGAAWKFAENGAKIYVHPIGLPHLVNPEKLWNSAALIYKDDMDRLWGDMKPIAEKHLIGVDEGSEINIGDISLKIWYTPGHAVHHNAIQYGDSIITGDVGGVKIGNGPVVPPCPPPDINVELWKRSIQKLRNLKPSALYLTHFARQEDPETLFDELETTLDNWADWIKPYYDRGSRSEEITPEFMEYVRNYFIEKGLNDHEIRTYEYANPSWMSVNGLLRYWKLKEQGRI
jgi:glyoxylase-like metal-dependent hydrolase (beta-lactamase superfamily II)